MIVETEELPSAPPESWRPREASGRAQHRTCGSGVQGQEKGVPFPEETVSAFPLLFCSRRPQLMGRCPITWTAVALPCSVH